MHDLISWGISSEQNPTSLTGTGGQQQSDEELANGNWNIQCTAAKTHLIDFSHFFVLPHSRVAPNWKMSEEAVSNALKAGWKFNSLFKSEALIEKIFGTKDKEEAMKKFT